MTFWAGFVSGLVNPLNAIREGQFGQIAIPSYQSGRAQLPDARYSTYAREGYQKNELVYACIEELSTSASEPKMHAKVRGVWTHEHPIVQMVRRPNPFMDYFEFWATVILHMALAGNAYGLIVPSASGRPVELWLMRPDRVRLVPSQNDFIQRYEYDTGMGEAVPLAVEDVIHWKWNGKNSPTSDFYGMPPLMPISGRVDIDNYMRDFVKSYFVNAGVPGGMLALKKPLSADLKQEIKDRFKNDYGGSRGWHSILVLDNTEATFTPMTRDLGASGLVVPALDEINEARICMAFAVPPELMGARVGMQNSSYAEKRSARESFWDETLAPLYKSLAGKMNLRLVPRFAGVEEIAFDLSDVRALQEDEDKIHARIRGDVQSGILSIEEARARVGYGELPNEGTFLVPGNMNAVPVDRLGEMPEPVAPAEPQGEPVSAGA